MQVRPPNSLTVKVDDREKDAYIIPETFEWIDDRGWQRVFKIKREDTRLKTGDIVLAGYESLAMVERKGSLQEMRDNIWSPDRARFGRCLKRLCHSTKVPIWLCDLPSDPQSNVKLSYGYQTPEQVWCAVYRRVHRYNMRLVIYHGPKTTEGRRAMGRYALWLLWTSVWEELNRVPTPTTREVP